MLYLAYDGSLNGDWIARYALQLASASGEAFLRLLHVQDGLLDPELVDSKLGYLAQEAGRRQLDLEIQRLPLQGSVAQTLLRQLPGGPKHILLCGTRARTGRRALLAGTTAERLLRAHPCPTLALRVVHPGLMGQPGKLLLPLAGHPRLLAGARPLLQRLLPTATEVFLLRVVPLTRLSRHQAPHARLQALRQPGVEYLRQAREELQAAGLAATTRVDWRVVISEDWPGEILLHCSHFKTEFALLGASERLLSRLPLPGNPLERILHDSPCDLGIYRGPD